MATELFTRRRVPRRGSFGRLREFPLIARADTTGSSAQVIDEDCILLSAVCAAGGANRVVAELRNGDSAGPVWITLTATAATTVTTAGVSKPTDKWNCQQPYVLRFSQGIYVTITGANGACQLHYVPTRDVPWLYKRDEPDPRGGFSRQSKAEPIYVAPDDEGGGGGGGDDIFDASESADSGAGEGGEPLS